jgi:hypothetical protein
MKFTGYTLAFYLILLSAVPCCAFDNCPDEKTGEATNHDEPGDKDCGNCSPFFSCEGCATATIAFEPAKLEITAVKTPSVYTAYIQTALPSVEYDFWQPPKLGL